MALGMVRKSKLTNASKHIFIYYHYIRTVIEDRVTTVQYVPSENQSLDVLTKRLARVLDEKHTAGTVMKENKIQDEEQC